MVSLQPNAGMGAWTLWFLQDLRYGRFAPCNDADMFGRCFRALRQLVQQCPIGRLVLWRHRMDTAFQPQQQDDEAADGPSPQTHLEPILDPVHGQHRLLQPLLARPLVMPPCRRVPVCLHGGERIIWILHLFSGRRRIGDCHWWLDHIGKHLWPGIRCASSPLTRRCVLIWATWLLATTSSAFWIWFAMVALQVVSQGLPVRLGQQLAISF